MAIPKNSQKHNELDRNNPIFFVLVEVEDSFVPVIIVTNGLKKDL